MVICETGLLGKQKNTTAKPTKGRKLKVFNTIPSAVLCSNPGIGRDQRKYFCGRHISFSTHATQNISFLAHNLVELLAISSDRW